jgi:hypothetical protein
MDKMKTEKATKGKKAQIKMFENVAVMIIFFFLLIFGASFYFTLQKASLQTQVERINQLAAVQQALRLTYLPELDCSFLGVQKENCFDEFKVISFHDNKPENDLAYFNIFGYSNITLKTIYPNPLYPNFETKKIYERAPPNISSSTQTQIPVLICKNGCDPLNLQYSFGVLEVDYYVPKK